MGIKRKKDVAFYEMRRSILNGQSYTCAYCECDLTNIPSSKINVDHMIALANGGKDEYPNFAVVCDKCNRMKGALSFGEFLEKVKSEKIRLEKILENSNKLIEVEQILLKKYGKEIC